MGGQLPARANLEYYRKQAKTLLKAYRSGDEGARGRMGLTDNGSAGKQSSRVRLSHAQQAVARELGFGTWTQLKAAITDARSQENSLQEETPTDDRTVKQQFESDPAVQRWLRESTPDTQSDFAPTFLKEHADRDWILSSLGVYQARGLITDVIGTVKSGKEATVLCCRAHPDTGYGYLAAKIYRPRMFRNLKNDAVYRTNRMPARDRRLQKAVDKMSRRGRNFRMTEWIEHEYEVHKRLWDAGVTTPRPLDQYGNSILMELVGEEAQAAPHLYRVRFEHDEAVDLFQRLIGGVELMLACDCIHGDLSAYNILYDRGEASIIDFAQAVDARSASDVFPLLLRDIERLTDHFGRFGVTADPSDIALSLWSRYTHGILQP